MVLSRHQFLKLCVCSVVAFGFWAFNPLALLSLLLPEEEEYFTLPDRMMHALIIRRDDRDVVTYQAVLVKSTEREKAGTVAWVPFMDEIKDVGDYLVLNGRRLRVKDWPELAEAVNDGMLGP